MNIIYEDCDQAYIFDDLIKLEQTLAQTTEPSKSQHDDIPWEYHISKAVIRNNELTMDIYLRQYSANARLGQSGWKCDAKLKPQLIAIIDTFTGKVNATNVEYESIDSDEEYIKVTMEGFN